MHASLKYGLCEIYHITYSTTTLVVPFLFSVLKILHCQLHYDHENNTCICTL